MVKKVQNNGKIYHGLKVIRLILLAVLLAAGCLIILQPNGPAVAEATAQPQLFSAGRAFLDVNIIAQKPHPVGSDEHFRVRGYIADRLKSLSLEVKIQSTNSMKTTGQTIRAATVENVIATLRGTNSTGEILFVGHYDTMPWSPGAMDNSAAVATLLETARALKSGLPLKNDVLFLLTDDEEGGGFGADAFVKTYPEIKDVALVVNFDARGNSGPFIMFESSQMNDLLIRDFAKSAPYPVTTSLAAEVYKRMPNATDFNAFKKVGLPGFDFACIDGWNSYHNGLDTPENLSKRSLQHEGSYALSLAQYFGSADLTPLRAQPHINMTYFDVLGFTVIRYPTAWTVYIAVILSVFYLVLFGVSMTRKRIVFLRAAFWVTIPLLIVLLYLLTAEVSFYVLSHFYDERMLSFHSISTVCGVILLILPIPIAIGNVAAGKNELLDFAVGALGWWMLFMWVSILIFPAAAYLFLWPLAFGLVGCCGFFVPGTSWKAIFLTLFFSGPIMMLVCPVFYNLMIAMGFKVMVLTITLAGMAIPLLLVPFFVLGKMRIRWIILGSVLSGLIFFRKGFIQDKYTTEHPQLDNVVYALDADQNRAVLASPDRFLDSWTAAIFGPAPTRSLLTNYTLENLSYYVTNAQTLSLKPPELAVLSDEVLGNIRDVHFRIRSNRAAPLMQLRTGNEIVECRLNNNIIYGAKGSISFPKGLILYYNGLPSSGVEVEFKLIQKDLTLQLADETYGLPSEYAIKERPSFILRGTGSDRTYVHKTFQLPLTVN